MHATIQKIRDTNIFPDDKGILRRIAHVATNDGEDENTYSEKSNTGGIFRVSVYLFLCCIIAGVEKS